MTAPRPYGRRVLVAIDQLGNALIPDWFIPGGDEDETISSRLGKAMAGVYGPEWAAKRRVRWLAGFVDGIALHVFGQPGHCAASIERDEGWPA